MNASSSSNAALNRETARMHTRNRDLLVAEQFYWRVLEEYPSDIEALQFLANEHLARDDLHKAIELLSRAHVAQPDDPTTLHQLGTAQLKANDFASAAHNLRKALLIAPRMFIARLRLGIALENLDLTHDALLAYFRALNDAQAQGRWRNDSTTAPALRQPVKHAMDYVDNGRKRVFEETLDPLRQRYGRSELRRIDLCLAIYLNEQPANLPDPRQQPKFLYFPEIPSQPFYPRERFPWQAALESAGGVIRDELCSVMAKPDNLESFLESRPRDENDEYLQSSSNQAAAWDAYFFHRHGERYNANCKRCPNTTALLDSLPLVRIREHAPETLFSVLRPGTHIMPHRGVTNTRLVTHLPLAIPADCALRVGGETHTWKQDQCVTFDDTFEHEAWNRSNETRVVLIIDSWNPDLSEAERAAVTDLVAAIGDLNRAVAN
jgi:aspartate beta-hydroxylase